MRVLLLSAYDAESHRVWRQNLLALFDEWQWTVLTLPARHFSWHMGGNALLWSQIDADQQNAALYQDYDLILATSMVDIASLKGLCPQLASTPCLLYFHENQFAYPQSEQQHSVVELQLQSIYAALASTRIAFNSRYNLDSFFDGVDSLLRRLPGRLPAANIVQKLKAKSRVLPVPLEPVLPRQPSALKTSGLNVVWNHRWEYDKAPDRLLEILKVLPKDLPLCFHVVGQRFRQCPQVMDEIKALLEARSWLGEWGYIDDRFAYMNLLARCDVVLSTALHDFQGLSVLEAVAQGCTPLVPERLVYPEYVEAAHLYESHLEQVDAEACAAADKLHRWCSAKPLAPSVTGFLGEVLRPRYQDLLQVAATTE